MLSEEYHSLSEEIYMVISLCGLSNLVPRTTSQYIKSIIY